MSADRPRLGLVMGLRRPPQWEPLVEMLTEWWQPQFDDGTGDRPAAWLASSPTAGKAKRLAASGGRVAVMSPRTGAEVAGSWAVVVWTGGEVEGGSAPGAAGVPVVRLSTLAVDSRASWPMTPFVRARWRRARGLPEGMVVDPSTLPTDGDADVRAAALALAGAVIAFDPAVAVEALAWGAPVVTGEEAADTLGAEDSVHLLVREPVAAASAAAALAADHRLGARLGRAGRRLVEDRHDLWSAGASLTRRLGQPATADPVLARLNELHTPAGARVRGRAAALAGGIRG